MIQRHARPNRRRQPDPPAVGPEFWIGVANCLVLSAAIVVIIALLVFR